MQRRLFSITQKSFSLWLFPASYFKSTLWQVKQFAHSFIQQTLTEHDFGARSQVKQLSLPLRSYLLAGEKDKEINNYRTSVKATNKNCTGWKASLKRQVRGFSEQPGFYLCMEGWNGVFRKIWKDSLGEKEESMCRCKGAGGGQCSERYKILHIVLSIVQVAWILYDETIFMYKLCKY